MNMFIHLSPIRPGFFIRLPARGGGEGGRLRGPNAKNQAYHQPTEMELCMGHYSHKHMPDAKFEYGSFSIFGDTTSQNFSLEK